MESKENDAQPTPAQDTEAKERIPKADPKNAAGSLNPKEEEPFYAAVVKRTRGRKRR